MNPVIHRKTRIIAIASPDPKSSRPTSKREDAFCGPRARRGVVAVDAGGAIETPMIRVEMTPNPAENMSRTSIVNMGVPL